MTWTSHGHHMPGTRTGRSRPIGVATCGGPKVCEQCKAETVEEIRLNNTVSFEDPAGYAMRLVSELVSSRRLFREDYEQTYDVKVLEFSQQDGSWRALLETIPDDKQRFMVTYRKGDRQVELSAWTLTILDNIDVG